MRSLFQCKPLFSSLDNASFVIKVATKIKLRNSTNSRVGRLFCQIKSTSLDSKFSILLALLSLLKLLTIPTSSVIVFLNVSKSRIRGACSSSSCIPSARHSGTTSIFSIGLFMRCSEALFAKTTASNRLFDANLFAPCIPVHATSPIPYKPGIASPFSIRTLPSMSTFRPPTM